MYCGRGGFGELELTQLKDIIKSTAHLIIRFARQGGLGGISDMMTVGSVI